MLEYSGKSNLTHWGRDKMAAVFQTTFWNGFSWMKMHEFRLKFHHTMDLLWDKFQWILPLYMKPISFQSKASVVYSVTAAIFIDFWLKKLNVFSQHIGKKNWISEFRRKNPREMKCWSTFCVNYFLRYYLMMQHQPIVKRVNGTHEWAHRPYQLLSAPYHCCLYKHRRQDERQPLISSCVHSNPPSPAYMRQWTGSALVQVMACRLFGAKPLPEPMLA